MSDESKTKAKGEGGADSGRVLVEDASGRRPFMRGIMVHSLTALGVGFEEALQTADQVRDQIRGRDVVPRVELAKMVSDILGEEAPTDHQPPLPLPAQIEVFERGGESAPFSKGRLSQSLLAASLDPNDAFDVSREIEMSLHGVATQSISRLELRELVVSTLRQRFGPKTAARYMTWREYEEPEKPVIVLLGGTTGSGKTSLALEVALRLGISRVLSTDSIRQVMRTMLSADLMPAIHVSSFEAYRHLNLDPTGEGPVVGGFMSQAAAVSVGVRAIMDRAVEENTNLVLDGVGLVPGLIDLDAYRDVANVVYLVVARLDGSAFRDHFESRVGREHRRDAGRYVENLGAILEIQDYILELADRYNVPIVDNVSLDGSVILIIRHIVETLRKRGGIDVG